MTFIDYRDRASVMIWVVLAGLSAQRFLTLPERSFSTELFGSPLSVTITANTIVGILLAGLIVTGIESVVRAHPRSQLVSGSRRRSVARTPVAGARFAVGDSLGRAVEPLRSHWIFWGFPIALIAVAVLLLPLAPTGVYWVLGVVATAIALGLSAAGIYYTIDPFQTGYRRARLGMNALTYGIALVLFLVVYRTRVRSFVSATEVLLISSLLALELLRGSERPTVLVALYAAITGLVLGQATWALNYWRLDSLTGGLVLLVLFYDIVGLSTHALQGRIRRRILLEYLLITVTAMALIWEFAP